MYTCMSAYVFPSILVMVTKVNHVTISQPFSLYVYIIGYNNSRSILFCENINKQERFVR